MGSKGYENGYTNGVSTNVNGYQASSAIWANTAPNVRLSFIFDLEQLRIHVYETEGKELPFDAVMHDVAASVPDIVITPRTELQVKQTLGLIYKYGLYGKVPISVKSGGHGYFNGGTCVGIMINLARLDYRKVKGSVLYAGPGCAGSQTIDILSKHKKAVPHGDCFGVGAGGHFITAGWCIILARKHGLGCQNVIGGRVLLWDGKELEVDEDNHPDLLHAMRGGAAAGVGIVTEVRLKLIDEPERAIWKWTYLTQTQVETCVRNNAFRRAQALPKDITIAFRFFFKPERREPICSFNIQSLVPAAETIAAVRDRLGDEVADMIADLSQWNEGSLVDLRMQPASDLVNNNRSMLADMTITALHSTPNIYWESGSLLREMQRSYFTSVSYWVVSESDTMLLDLWDAFDRIKDTPARDRTYALLIQGGGRMNELQDICSMPVGRALSRFELHWDKLEEEQESRRFTAEIEGIMEARQDPKINRPYRGDVWKVEQTRDEKLEAIGKRYFPKGYKTYQY